ncbi:hypothetical protein [Roseovarius sp.]|uniref:hypothetical protein n=1 Tax=Roseovarius sp. TaxID=1486281 RepID=UPI002631EEFF|nr:hypothetical protein [Roseovarius sp.]MDM8166900.1 hypothetical protein [Roseovarius sp.]
MLARRLFTAAALAALATAATAHDSQILQIAGQYTAQGRYPDGRAYAGVVEIIQQGSEVEIYWSIDGQSYQGRGNVQGRIVTVNWGAATPIIYLVTGRELHGTWDNGTGLERLMPR